MRNRSGGDPAAQAGEIAVPTAADLGLAGTTPASFGALPAVAFITIPSTPIPRTWTFTLPLLASTGALIVPEMLPLPSCASD